MTVVLAALLAGAAAYAASGGWSIAVVRRRLRRAGSRSVARSATAQVRRAVARRRSEAIRRAAVIEWCAALAAELRAGRLPDDAVLHAARYWPGVAPRAVRAAESGLDVVDALRADATEPGAGGLRGVAACLRVAGSSGAGLAAAVDRVSAVLRADAEQRDRVAAELAGPRSTARLLAMLPVAGLGMGHAIGANPLGVLLGTGWGRAAAVLGLALDAVGVWWVGVIAARAERTG